jgi:EAL domain-containing protein (putative c-di-GMP-specific phosphodiesterase class I)
MNLDVKTRTHSFSRLMCDLSNRVEYGARARSRETTPVRGKDRAAALRRGARALARTTSLRHAINRHELSLHFQPQYDILGGYCCGVEALARWFLPDGPAVAPEIFIRHAEHTGLISSLGSWALEMACMTVSGWNDMPGVRPILCVNVSPRQICHEFSAVISRTLKRTGFPADRLELEITEGTLVEDIELALECLAQWKDIGVRVALDDFGTGYSSLSYLSRLPVDRLKVDKSLIWRIVTDRKTAAIVRALISLGEDLGFAVLAEGVETEAQLEALARMGCRQAQGYLFTPPVCADKAKLLLEQSWGARPIHSPTAACAAKVKSRVI